MEKRYFLNQNNVYQCLHPSLLNCEPCVLKTCSCFNVSCVLTCSCVNVPCVLVCQRALRAHMPTCLPCLRPKCLACSRAHMECALRAYMLTCPRTLRALPANWQSALRAHVQKVSTVKFFFCPVFY